MTGSFVPFHWSTTFLLHRFCSKAVAPCSRRSCRNRRIRLPDPGHNGMNSRLDDAGVAAVAKALFAIRSYFMRSRVKAARI